MHRESPTQTKPTWRETFLGLGDDRETKNVSWGAIFAGVATSIAVLLAFSLLGTAIGLGVITPTSDEPFAGLGVGLAIWAVVTLLIALAAGGFVTGVLAGRAGFIHGVVAWAGGMIVVAVLLTTTAGAAIGAAGTIVGGAANAVGSGAGSVASALGDTLDGATDSVSDALSSVNTDEVAQQTRTVLEGTGVPELQPDYLTQQAEEATDQVAAAGRELLVHPENHEKILGDLGDDLTQRAEKISDSIDRDAIARSVAANTDLTGAEAQAAVDNIADGAQTLADNAREAFANAESALDEAATNVANFVDDARENLDKASDQAAGAAAWGFVAALLALAISAFAGLLGARAVAPERRKASA